MVTHFHVKLLNIFTEKQNILLPPITILNHFDPIPQLKPFSGKKLVHISLRHNATHEKM